MKKIKRFNTASLIMLVLCIAVAYFFYTQKPGADKKYLISSVTPTSLAEADYLVDEADDKPND